MRLGRPVDSGGRSRAPNTVSLQRIAHGEDDVIPRYTREEMGRVWSDANRYQKWLDVELAAADTLAEAGLVPKDAAALLRARARVDVARINELEARVKHDVIAFTMAVGETIGDPGTARWLHYGMTSNDVVDTAQALLLQDASHIIERDLIVFAEILDLRAHEFQHTPQIGRTHGIHAEPITFGLKIANWFAENQRNIARFREAARGIAFGKISGAVGNAAHLGPEVEEKICKRLGLQTTPVASQVIQRDRHAHYLSALALIAASLEKIALEIRHLQRTEVREAEEHFGGEQRGSSAMPHKRNPVTSEQICGLGAGRTRQHDGRARKRGALARAGHFPFFRGARDFAGFHDPAGLHAFEDDHDRRRNARVSAPYAAQSGIDARAGLLGPAIARPGGEGNAERRRVQGRPGKCHGGVGIGRRVSGNASQEDARIANI